MKNQVIILNAKIYTVDSEDSVKEALVIDGNKIAYVGTNEGAEEFIDRSLALGESIEFVDLMSVLDLNEQLNSNINSLKVIDLQGHAVLPGLVDSHIHPPGTSLTDLYEVSLYGLDSVDECKDAIRTFIERNKGIDAVYGRGWSLGIFEGDEVSKGPRKEHLDEVSRDIPIILRAYDGHTLWLNSKAFDKFQIDENTPCPTGGKIEIDDDTNEVWGTLKESATHLVKEGEYTDYQYQKAFELFEQKMHRFGVTSILSLSGFKWGIQPQVYKNLIDENKLKMRISAGFSISPEEDPIEQIDRIKAIRDNFDSDYFKTTTVKLLADGVVEGSTASLIEPYELEAGKGSDYCGEFLWDRYNLPIAIDKANREGFSIHVHSVGDNATKTMLDAIEQVQNSNDIIKRNNISQNNRINQQNSQTQQVNIDYRNALTHLQLVRAEDIDRFKKLNVIASVQPYWHMKGPNWWDVVDYKLVGKRAEDEYPLNSFVKSGVKIASSSDHSVTPIPNPFFAMQAGVTRNLYNAGYFGAENVKDMDEPQWLLNKNERVSVEDIVRSFTINGAYLIFRDDEIGSIEVGKCADFIVLDRDIFEINPVDIGDTQVLMTFFDGEVVYKKEHTDN